MKNSLPDLSKQLKAFRYGRELHPYRDWMVLVTVCAFLILLSIAWNLWLFAKVTGGETIGGEATPSLRPAKLETVTELFNGRTAEQSRYLNEYRFVDPSGPAR